MEGWKQERKTKNQMKQSKKNVFWTKIKDYDGDEN